MRVAPRFQALALFRWLLHLTADDDSLAFSTSRKESLSRKLRHWVVGRPTNRSRLTPIWSQLQADCEELANWVSLLQRFRTCRAALCCLCHRGSQPEPPRLPERFDLLTLPGLRVDAADKSASASTLFSTYSPGPGSASPRALSVTEGYVSRLRLLSEASGAKRVAANGIAGLCWRV